MIGFSRVALLALACGAAFSCSGKPLVSRDIRIDGSTYEYRAYRPSVPGRFLFTPRDKDKGTNSLVILDAGGGVVFQKSFGVNKLLHDFKKIEPGRYGYFETTLGALREEARKGAVQFRFLDEAFREITPRPVPNDDAELDEHDVARKKNGNLLFLFYRESGKDGLIDAEIQEWDPKAGKVHTWSSKDSLRPARGAGSVMDYLHANSIEEDADGGLILSFCATSEIVKIAYPSGTVLWRLSHRAWKFPNDPLKGFRLQHSARRLANGNILLYDNGGGGHGDISRAVEYKLDEKARVATMVWERRAAPDAPFRPEDGSVQRLSNGNTLIGWGEMPDKDRSGTRRIPMFTEVDHAGNVVRELTSLGYRITYRVSFEETP
ncbi:MAG: aryl-sulfate sulfotransferase [Elusimicrobia bacterium]|nr:aryl-sulfate sulfotransferase [Elusimicrobiota bacterium]